MQVLVNGSKFVLYRVYCKGCNFPWSSNFEIKNYSIWFAMFSPFFLWLKILFLYISGSADFRVRRFNSKSSNKLTRHNCPVWLQQYVRISYAKRRSFQPWTLCTICLLCAHICCTATSLPTLTLNINSTLNVLHTFLHEYYHYYMNVAIGWNIYIEYHITVTS